MGSAMTPVINTQELKAVAVGMSETQHLPHHAAGVTCGTTVLGFCLGSDAETLFRVRVLYPRSGSPFVDVVQQISET